MKILNCQVCGAKVIYQRAPKNNIPLCEKHRMERRYARERENSARRRKAHRANREQQQWSAGAGAKPSPRVDKLAALYKRLETWTKMPNAPRGELLEMQAAFAELKAPCHVARCQALYEGSMR